MSIWFTYWKTARRDGISPERFLSRCWVSFFGLAVAVEVLAQANLDSIWTRDQHLRLVPSILFMSLLAIGRKCLGLATTLLGIVWLK